MHTDPRNEWPTLTGNPAEGASAVGENGPGTPKKKGATMAQSDRGTMHAGAGFYNCRGGMPEELTAEELAEAREWLADCVWADVEPEQFGRMSGAEIVRGVRRHYCGGLAGFRAACAGGN